MFSMGNSLLRIAINMRVTSSDTYIARVKVVVIDHPDFLLLCDEG
jgi:hypothetical protein